DALAAVDQLQDDLALGVLQGVVEEMVDDLADLGLVELDLDRAPWPADDDPPPGAGLEQRAHVRHGEVDRALSLLDGRYEQQVVDQPLQAGEVVLEGVEGLAPTLVGERLPPLGQ